MKTVEEILEMLEDLIKRVESDSRISTDVAFQAEAIKMKAILNWIKG
jgi:hypothetical protein